MPKVESSVDQEDIPAAHRKRQTQSCDRCKNKKRKCDGNVPCSNCVKAESECTMEIQQKKRGPKKLGDGESAPAPNPAAKKVKHQQQQQQAGGLSGISSSTSSIMTATSSTFPPNIINNNNIFPGGKQPNNSLMMMGVMPPHSNDVLGNAVLGMAAPLQNNLINNNALLNGSNALFSADDFSLRNGNVTPGITGNGIVSTTVGNGLANGNNEIDSLLGSSTVGLDNSVQFGRVLDFDTDFAFNFALDGNNNFPFVDIPLDQIKPSSYNHTSFFPQSGGDSQPLRIDPEVLNLYTQLNPKLTIQNDLDLFLSSTLGNNTVPTDDSFIYGATNLTIPELPGIPTTFYMHLISMFFTYYHSGMPIVQETVFLENLVPTNKHHPMLLNTIYAIGCHYSRSPYLYQSPFYTPQKAVDYFVARALAATPAPESWSLITSNSLAISQASLLLASTDFQTKKSHTWMMIGMIIRLNQRFEMQADRSAHDFFSVCNGITKFNVDCTTEERKRIWLGSMLSDLFLSLSTGSPLLINEADYVGTLISSSSSHVQAKPFSLAQSESNPIINQGQTRLQMRENRDSEKWMPFFSGFPKDTIFGASDVTSELWGRQSFGFFQVGHLFSNLDSFSHLMQLSFFTRRAIRYAASAIPPSAQLSVSASTLYSLIPPNNGNDITRIHDALILWYENLPVGFRLWTSLEVCVSDNYSDMSKFCSFGQGERLSSVAVMLNLLFFATISILHQKNADNATSVVVDATSSSSSQKFRISSSLLYRHTFDSVAMLKMAYRADTFLLRKVYGQHVPPKPTTIPPSELVGSSIIGCLLMPTATALLGQDLFASKLIEKAGQTNFFTEDHTGIDPLEAVFLPVLDNIGQVWPIAHNFASTLKLTMNSISSKINRSAPIHQMWEQFSQDRNLTAVSPLVPVALPVPQKEVVLPAENNLLGVPIIGNFNANNAIIAGPPGNLNTVVASTNNVAEKTWHELRDEFEDEFLL